MFFVNLYAESSMRFAVLLLSMAFFTSQCTAQELSKEQMEPWSTLKRQVGLYFERDWEEHDKYIHPKIVDWGGSIPSPIHSGDDAKRYWQEFEEGSEKVVAFHMVPVSVVVAGDVAIINAYVHALTRPDGNRLVTNVLKGDRTPSLDVCSPQASKAIAVA